MSNEGNPASTHPYPPLPAWVWWTCAGLTLVKLWLTGGQRIVALAPLPHDDQLFVVQALSLIRGEWLGPYDAFTLIKGPFFPMWIAFVFYLGIPLLVSAQLLYALSAWLLAIAVRPVLHKDLHIAILFGILLFNPESSAMTRVLRELISPALAMLVAACSIGVLLRWDREGRPVWWWAIGLGLSLAALWLTREEGVVVLPFLLSVVASGVFMAWRRGKARGVWRILRLWLVGAGLSAGLILLVATVNWVRYGVFAKTEFDAPSFKVAFGAVSRVRPPYSISHVPVTKATRLRIYHVSPAFKELRPFLDPAGAPSPFIAAQQGFVPNDPVYSRELAGIYFAWAMRAAVDAAEYYDSGRFPAEYYDRLAREINSACDSRLLDCSAPRATFFPVWSNAYLRPWLSSTVSRLIEVASFQRVELHSLPSVGLPEELAQFSDATGGPIAPPKQHTVRIDAVSGDPGLSFVFRDEQGNVVGSRLQRLASTEFAAHLAMRGPMQADADKAGYSLVAACAEGCRLEIWAAGRLRETLPLSTLTPSIGVSDRDGVTYRVVAHEFPGQQEEVTARHRLDAFRLSVLTAIWRMYQILGPLLSVLGLLGYAALSIRCWRMRAVNESWIVLTAIGIYLATRVAFISFVSTSSVILAPAHYVYEAYAMLLAVVTLGFLDTWSRSTEQLAARFSTMLRRTKAADPRKSQ